MVLRKQPIMVGERKKGLLNKDVINITKDEAKQLYYEEFWKPSGADKLQDLREAYILFDMSVNSSPYVAKKLFKQSDENIYQFLKNRKVFYNNLIKRSPDQKVFEEGWMKRLKDVENNMNEIVNNGYYVPPYANEVTPFDDNYYGSLKKVKNLNKSENQNLKNKYQYLLNKNETITGHAANFYNTEHIFTPEEIGNMTSEEFEQNLPIIEQQLKEGLIKPQSEQPKDYSNFKNPETGTDKIYTREDISKMTTDEYSKNEKEIMAQMNSIGIPYKNDLPSNVKTQEKEKSYATSSSDGKWVTINGNHVLIKD